MASALFVLTLSLAVAGIVTLAMSYFMPARTRQGAMLYAMLSAYKRTLALTMTESNSMGEVVQKRALPWVTTPDEAMVWGVAFGLESEVGQVLARTLAASTGEAADTADAAASTGWYPTWWTMASHSGGHGGSAGTVSFSRESAGLFSSSPIPDPGSIVAALGSMASPSAPYSGSSGGSSSSFSSGSFGGGGGGGGGGAGGGF